MTRPTEFKDEYIEQADKLYLLGATDIQICDFFWLYEKNIKQLEKETSGVFTILKKEKNSNRC